MGAVSNIAKTKYKCHPHTLNENFWNWNYPVFVWDCSTCCGNVGL